MSRARRGDRSAAWTTLVLLLACESVLVLVLVHVAREAAPVLAERGLLDFLLREPWAPGADPPRLGVAHAWVSSLAVTAVALALAVPLGLGIGVFAAEIAPPPLRLVLQPCLELLAGIPSVVYGFFGAVTLVRGFERWLALPAGECLLAAGAILGVMTLPFVASTCAEAFRSVPAELREASRALGVTRAHALLRVHLPVALPGVLAAVTLGLARAIGETLAVLMLAGNSAALPRSLLDRGQPLTALVATEVGGAAVGTPLYHAVFGAGFLLLVVTALLHALVHGLKRRLVAP